MARGHFGAGAGSRRDQGALNSSGRSRAQRAARARDKSRGRNFGKRGRRRVKFLRPWRTTPGAVLFSHGHLAVLALRNTSWEGLGWGFLGPIQTSVTQLYAGSRESQTFPPGSGGSSSSPARVTNARLPGGIRVVPVISSTAAGPATVLPRVSCGRRNTRIGLPPNGGRRTMCGRACARVRASLH